jgi:hypothetical protein
MGMKQTRMNGWVGVVVVVCALGAPEALRADEGILSLAGRAGSAGLGLEVAKSLGPRANLRGTVNFFRTSHSLDADLASGAIESNVHFDGTAHLKTAGLLLDVYPTPAFHFTGGVVYNRNALDFDARPTAPITVNDESYSPDEIGVLNGSATLGRKWAPYAGIGFGNPLGARKVTFLFDLGVVFQGAPHVTLVSSRAAEEGLAADLSTAADQVNREHLDKTYFKYYPVLSIGVGVRVF